MLTIKKTYRLSILLFVVVMAFAWGSCSTEKKDHYDENYGRGTAASTLTLKLNEKGFTSFAKALETTKYNTTLSSSKSFTVFAPSNEEFDKETSKLSDADLKIWVGYHIIEPAYSRVRLVDTIYKTLSGKYLKYDPKNLALLDPYGKKVATFSGDEISCDNGIIQPISTVLKPFNSLAVELKNRYPLFFKILTEGFITTGTTREYQSAFDENGVAYVDSSYAQTADFINPYKEKGQKTVLAVSDDTIKSTFKYIEKAFKGSSNYDNIMHYFYNKMFQKHFYNEPLYSWHFAKGRIPISQTAYVDLDTVKRGTTKSRMKLKNLLASNGIIHEYDSIMSDFTWTSYLDSSFLAEYDDFSIQYQPWNSISLYNAFITGDRSIIKPSTMVIDGKTYEAYVFPYYYLRLFAYARIDTIYSNGIGGTLVDALNPIKYVDVTIPNVPGADFMLSLGFPSFYSQSAIVQVSVDGVNIGQPFDASLINKRTYTTVNKVTTETTPNPFGDEALRAIAGKGAYSGSSPDIFLGKLKFSSFGKRVVRFTIVGTSSTSQTSIDDMGLILDFIRLTPLDPNSKK